MYNKMVTYAVPVPAMKEKGTIANVPFQTQQGTPLVQIIIIKRYSVYTGLTNQNGVFLIDNQDKSDGNLRKCCIFIFQVTNACLLLSHWSVFWPMR